MRGAGCAPAPGEGERGGRGAGRVWGEGGYLYKFHSELRSSDREINGLQRLRLFWAGRRWWVDRWLRDLFGPLEYGPAGWVFAVRREFGARQ
jgi:hypothetical protein